MSKRNHVALIRDGVGKWNAWRKAHPDVRPDLSSADLRDAKLAGANLARTNLEWADLEGAILTRANLGGADLGCAKLNGATLDHAFLGEADLDWAWLNGTTLRNADLRGASAFAAQLHNADLTGATLVCTYFENANLSGAKLVDANLRKAVLRGTNLSGATLLRCNVYGIACWDLALSGTTQAALCVSPEGTPAVTVDSIELAQFIYLLLNNKNLRTVIDTITSKAVLILGRFTRKRKPILDALHDVLRDKHGFVPIMFDFQPSKSRDLTETVQLLAGMCRFVIADITEARSIPQELSHIIPNFPSVPVRPIIQASARPYAMFEHWQRFPNVLPEHCYQSGSQLLRDCDTMILKPVDLWRDRTRKSSVREQLLRDHLAEREGEIARLTALLSGQKRGGK